MPDGDEDDRSPAQSAWDRLADLPDLDDAPLDAPWMRSRAPADPGGAPTSTDADAFAPETTSDDTAAAPELPEAIPHDGRQFRIAGAATDAHHQPPASIAPTPHTTPGPEPGGPGELEPGPPQPAPSQDGAPRRARPRRRRRGWIAALIILPLVAAAGFGLYAWVLWGQVDKIDTDGALSAASAGFENYLIVGVDSRAGVDPDLSTAGSIGLGVAGSRSDTMVLLHVGEPADRMVSLPRDLWVDVPGQGGNKLNAATALGGPPALIRTVQANLDVPVHHYLEVDIAGFLAVVEALGSITIDFDAPACDPKSGLDVRQTGSVALDAEQALAYVRSRTYTEFDVTAAAGLDCRSLRRAGLGTTVGNADFGRTERQRRFLLAVFDEASSTLNPVTLLSVLSGLTDGLRVDESMGIRDAFGLFRNLRGLDADTSPLPVVDFAAPNGSAALQLGPTASEVLDTLR